MNNVIQIEKENEKEVYFVPIEIGTKESVDKFIKKIEILQDSPIINDQIIVTSSEFDQHHIELNQDLSNLRAILNESLQKKDLLDKAFFEVIIYVSKSNYGIDNCFTFYSNNSFYKFLTESEERDRQLNYEEIMKKFEFFNLKDGKVRIRLLNLLDDSVNDLSFSYEEIIFGSSVDYDQHEKLNKINESSNSQFQFQFLPEYFYFNEQEIFTFEPLNNLRRKMLLLFSINAISNYTEFRDSKIELRIVGTKLIEYEIDFTNDFTGKESNIDDIYSIYKWIYDSDNVEERLEISRNILTLYFDGISILNNSAMFLPSIKSNFEIYLKDNVDRYIEVLNSVVVLLRELNKTITDKVNELVSKFKTNLVGFFTFFVSTVLFNVLSEAKLNNIFTKDISMITIVFLLVSILFLIISILELNLSIKRISENYKADKKYYSALLNEDDIERIFNHDKNFKDDISYLKLNRCIIVIAWIIVILLVAVLVFFTGTISDIDESIFETIFR